MICIVCVFLIVRRSRESEICEMSRVIFFILPYVVGTCVLGQTLTVIMNDVKEMYSIFKS